MNGVRECFFEFVGNVDFRRNEFVFVENFFCVGIVKFLVRVILFNLGYNFLR